MLKVWKIEAISGRKVALYTAFWIHRVSFLEVVQGRAHRRKRNLNVSSCRRRRCCSGSVATLLRSTDHASWSARKKGEAAPCTPRSPWKLIITGDCRGDLHTDPPGSRATRWIITFDRLHSASPLSRLLILFVRSTYRRVSLFRWFLLQIWGRCKFSLI